MDYLSIHVQEKVNCILQDTSMINDLTVLLLCHVAIVTVISMEKSLSILLTNSSPDYGATL
jgi:hypothetical protein